MRVRFSLPAQKWILSYRLDPWGCLLIENKGVVKGHVSEVEVKTLERSSEKALFKLRDSLRNWSTGLMARIHDCLSWGKSSILLWTAYWEEA